MWRVRMGWIETIGGRRSEAEALVQGGFASEKEAAAFANNVFACYLLRTFNSQPWFQTFQEAA